MTKIKLCGLKRPQDIETANEIKPDFVGFIVDFPKSRRNVDIGTLRALTASVSPGIMKVGVFVDYDASKIAGLLDDGTIDIAQLHGHEDEEYVGMLKGMTDKPVTKAFTVRSAEDISRALSSRADYILLDQGQGTGRSFNWSLVPRIERPWFLAGGLCPDNLAEAVERLSPWAVDLSSGIETDGLKDPVKMRAAVEAVRAL